MNALEETLIEVEMDLTGTICPLPILEVDAMIKHIPVNCVMAVLVSDPATLTDFPAWARITGQEIIDQVSDSLGIRFLIRKVK